MIDNFFLPWRQNSKWRWPEFSKKIFRVMFSRNCTSLRPKPMRMSSMHFRLSFYMWFYGSRAIANYEINDFVKNFLGNFLDFCNFLKYSDWSVKDDVISGQWSWNLFFIIDIAQIWPKNRFWGPKRHCILKLKITVYSLNIVKMAARL